MPAFNELECIERATRLDREIAKRSAEMGRKRRSWRRFATEEAELAALRDARRQLDTHFVAELTAKARQFRKTAALLPSTPAHKLFHSR